MTNKIWGKDFIILLLVNVTTSISFQCLTPNLPRYVSALGVPEGILGFLSSAVALAAMMTRPFAGRAADRLDRKLILIVTLLGTAATVFAFSLTTNHYILIGLRFIQGLFFGFNSTVALTAASHVLPEDKLGRGIGFFTVSMIGSQAVAPAMGVWIAALKGYHFLFYFNAMLSVAAAVITLFFKNQKNEIRENMEVSGRNGFFQSLVVPEAVGFAVINLFQVYAYAAINTFLILYGDRFNIGRSELYFTVLACTVIFVRVWCGKIADTAPIHKTVYVTYTLVMIAISLIVVTRSLPPLLIAAFIFGVGYGIGSLALQAACIKSVDKSRRGAASATSYITLDFANIIGPVFTGALAGAFGYKIAFATMIPVVFTGIVMMYYQYSRTISKSNK